jgi:hypothetical protein
MISAGAKFSGTVYGRELALPVEGPVGDGHPISAANDFSVPYITCTSHASKHLIVDGLY